VVTLLGVQPPAQGRRGKHVVAVVDLESGVAYLEAILEHALKLAPKLVAVLPGVHDHVSRQRRKARCDLPHVEVVDLDHPWLGVGPDNFLQMYRSRYILPEAWQEPNLSHPHNIVLDFLSRLGLLGFAAGAAMLLGFWQTAVRAYRRLRDSGSLEADNLPLLPLAVGLMGTVADMLAHGLVDHSFFLVDLAYVFFLALAAIQHIHRLSSQPDPMPASAAAAPLPV
jgi:hypothetical protein